MIQIQKRLFILIIALLLSVTLLHGAKQPITNIVIIPITNKGTGDIDYLSDVIRSNLYAFFKNITGYSVIQHTDLDTYLKQNTYTPADLKNPNNLFKLAGIFNADLILTGEYYEEDQAIHIGFEVIDSEDKKVIYRFNHKGPGGIDIIESVDETARLMIEDFTGFNLKLGGLIINADQRCGVYIDNELYGHTPFKQKLPSGKHTLSVRYRRENNVDGATNKEEPYTIYDRIITITEDQNLTLDLSILFTVRVDTDKACMLYINNRYAGTTPYTGRLLTGRSYELIVKYPNALTGKKQIIAIKQLPPSHHEDITLTIPVQGRITVHDSHRQLQVAINNENRSLPADFTLLDPGFYRVKVFTYDTLFKKNLVYFNKRLYLYPGEQKVINPRHLLFTKKPGLCLLPGGAQWYLNEKAKSTAIISLFSASLGATAALLATGFTTYHYEYVEKLKLMDSRTPATDRALITASNILWSSIATGAVSLVIYLYSLIDGAVTMHRMYRVFHGNTPRIRPVFDIRLESN